MLHEQELLAGVELDSPTAAPTSTIPPTPPGAVLTSGSLWQAIWTMSWPLLLITFGSSIAGIVNVQLARKFGTAGQAAVGLSELILFMFNLAIVSLGVGTTALVSRACGESDQRAAAVVTAQSLILAIVAGLLLTGTVLLTAQYIVPCFSSSAAVIQKTNTYLSINALYLVPFAIACMVSSAFRGAGNARVPLLIVISEFGVNISGACLTVLGNWPVPNLGIAGLAGSAVAGSLVGAAMALYCLGRSFLSKWWKLDLRESVSVMRSLLALGVPAAVHKLNYVLSIVVLFFVLTRSTIPRRRSLRGR